MLVLVLAVLAVSYASSLRAYLEQQRHLSRLQEQIAASRASIEELKVERERWKDPAYVRRQARDNLAFMMPGEIGYKVLDSDGRPLDPTDSLSDPVETTPAGPQWYEKAWDSVVLAGDPPDPDDEPQPADTIRPSGEPSGGQTSQDR